jgi:uncharacterized membrane protein
MSAERSFLVLATVFGVAFLAVTPPYQVADEYKHFFRAYQISEGQLGATVIGGSPGAFLPRSLEASVLELSRDLPFHPEVKQRPEEIAAELGRPLAPRELVFVRFHGLPSPAAYLPQAAAIAIGRAFEGPPIVLVWAGRLANLLAWIILTATALRWTRVQPWVWTLLALTPMSLFQAASLSPDASTNGVSLLFLSGCLRLSSPEAPPPSARHLCFLALLLAFVGFSKQAYAPLGLTLLMVPAERLGGGRRRAILTLGLLAAGLLPAVAWTGFAQALGVRELSPGADPAAQLRFLAEHPLRFLHVLAATCVEMKEAWVVSFLGVLGWLDVRLPAAAYALQGAALVALAVVESPPLPARARAERAVALIAFAACLVAMLVLAYVGWNQVGGPIIAGVQGRYFIPVAPLLALALRSRRLAVPEARLGGWIALLPAVVLVSALGALLDRYWLP